MSRFAFTYEDPDYSRDEDLEDLVPEADEQDEPEDNYYGA
jgi:hypothetical protein